MRPGIKSKNRRRGATIVLLMAMLPLLLIPLVGLAVDGCRLYIVQSKLSAAVDGAVLGAGRLLGTNANTTEIAEEFLNVNFPNGYWATTNLQKNITFNSSPTAQTISIYATVELPLTFTRLLGASKNLVSASAVATRRVTRVMIVLDRSGSMNQNDPVTGDNVFQTMKAGAQWFAAQFTPGYDEVGLVVFSSSGLVAYPVGRPWDPSPTGAGGPDKVFATDAQNKVGPIFDQLTAMGVGGGTGTPEALQLAYIELQKAHNRDLGLYGSDNTLNTIVLFTDGVPDAIATYSNDPNFNSLLPKATCLCTNDPATAVLTTQMKGYLVSPGGPPGNGTSFPGWGTSIGIGRLAAYTNSQTLAWWLSNTGSNDLSPISTNPINATVNCRYLGNAGNTRLDDLAKVPDFDMYGNSTTGNGYTNSRMSFFNGSNTVTWSPNTGAYNPSTPTRGYDIAAASWNLTDHIGTTIRSQTAMSQIQIFTIGYAGNSGTDIGLLTRLANTPASTSYDGTQSVGKFYLVNSTNQLSAAFDAVASSLLRLAQ